jgi:hypothetical protein
MNSLYNKLKILLPVVLLGAFLIGCSTHLLKDEELRSLGYQQSKDNKIVYYHKNFEVSEKGDITITTHHMLCIGENARLAPEVFAVFDGSIHKLIDFEGRIIHKNGNVEKYSKGSLNTLALSNRQRISENYMKYLPIEELLTAGDLVETVEIHKMELNGLGMDFSLDEIGQTAENITCTFAIPASDSLNYIIVNDAIKPDVVLTGDIKKYTFSWKHYFVPKTNNPFAKINTAPAIFANNVCRSWADYGDWYLQIAESKLVLTQNIVDVAKTITSRKNNDKEKMDAIFKYCRSNIRYEQVYLDKGEFIPNLPETILKKKYGDCKDYSTIIYVMAKSAGLNPNLALCHRGRGFEFYKDVPSSQFNHMIVHFSYNDKDYWYDGTNTAGAVGITTSDLLNSDALIIERGKSRIVNIVEDNENRVKISGTLLRKNKDLNGGIQIDCKGQYAIDFSIVANYTNQKNMREFVTRWLKDNVNENIVVEKLEWNNEGDNFIINTTCTFPNSFILLDSCYFVSLGRVFSSLLPENSFDFVSKPVFYYPYYGKLTINVDLPEFICLDNSSKAACLYADIDIPSGPYIGGAEKEFVPQYKKALEIIQYQNKLVKKDSK